MSLHFAKMHGLGNDFMVLDTLRQAVKLNPKRIRQWANRHTGIGFDQCLLVEAANKPDIDFNYRIFNADGHEVGQCGNGARCLALYLKHYGLTTKKTIRVATKTTEMLLTLNADDSVSIDMGKPRFAAEDIPLKIVANEQSLYLIPCSDGQLLPVHAVNVGNPHALVQVEQIDQAPVSTLGKELSEHPLFPEQVNAGFMQILSAQHIRLRVYERGCGETLACGSGAVAAVAVGRLFYQLNDNVRVSLPGGDLTVSWPDIKKSITLTGPAVLVYEGQLSQDLYP